MSGTVSSNYTNDDDDDDDWPRPNFDAAPKVVSIWIKSMYYLGLSLSFSLDLSLFDLLINILTPLPQLRIPTLISKPPIDSRLQLSDRYKIPTRTLLCHLRTCRAVKRIQCTFVRRNRGCHFHHEALESPEQGRIFALEIGFDHAGMERVRCQTWIRLAGTREGGIENQLIDLPCAPYRSFSSFAWRIEPCLECE